MIFIFWSRPAVLAVLATVVLGSCAPSSVPTPIVDVSADLRSCDASAVSPRVLPRLVTVPALRAGYDDERRARIADQLAAADCRETLRHLLSVVDAFNAEHNH